MAIKLVSPKIKQTVATKTKVDGHPGNYLRGTYKVKSGDTLYKIAKAYGVSVDYLAQINHVNNINRISEGQVLKVPPVKQRRTLPQPHAAAPFLAPHSSTSVMDAPISARGTSPKAQQQTNPDGESVTRLPATQPAIIFPLKVKPLNEEGGEFEFNNWKKGQHANAACFGSSRSKKDKHGNVIGIRRHAGRDLYAQNFTEVVAIAPGRVLLVADFYLKTSQISIRHDTSDGRQFVVRYGEVDPASITVNTGDLVKQGQIIGKTGILIDPKTNTPAKITQGKNVSMLHFEHFTGADGLDNATNLTIKGMGEYERRADITDSLALLQEGYISTFREGAPTLSNSVGNRTPVADLFLSELGENFIKSYEKLRLDFYNDAFGYCTIGWGHLTGGKTSCASQGILVGATVTEKEAQNLFDSDKKKHELFVKKSINVPLYQHEFDALCSLAFNIGFLKIKAPSLCSKINSGSYVEAAAEFLDITNNGLPGLVVRRKQENAMYLLANYDSTH